MARTKLQDKYCEAPVDWLKALVLERVNVRPGYNLKSLAADSKIPYSTLRRLMGMDTQDWSRAQRHSVCRALHISEAQLQQTAHF